MYNKCIQLKVKEQIKTLLAQRGVKLKELALKISDRSGKDVAANSLSHRLSRETITYNEVLLIADILGYDIKFIPRIEREN